jgi:hypothetical protein
MVLIHLVIVGEGFPHLVKIEIVCTRSPLTTARPPSPPPICRQAPPLPDHPRECLVGCR